MAGDTSAVSCSSPPSSYPAALDLVGIRAALLQPSAGAVPSTAPPSSPSALTSPPPPALSKRDKSTLVLSLTKRLRSMKQLLQQQQQTAGARPPGDESAAAQCSDDAEAATEDGECNKENEADPKERRPQPTAALKAAPQTQSAARAILTACSACAVHAAAATRSAAEAAALNAALTAERARAESDAERTARRYDAVIQEKDEQIADMRALMDGLTAQLSALEHPAAPTPVPSQAQGPSEEDAQCSTAASLSAVPAYPTLTPSSSPLLSAAALQQRLNDTEELITFDGRTPQRSLAAATASLPPRSPYPAPAQSTARRPLLPAQSSAAATVAGAWHSYLERSGMQRERELQALPITSPSTPDSKRRKLAQEQPHSAGTPSSLRRAQPPHIAVVGPSTPRTPASAVAAAISDVIVPVQLRFDDDHPQRASAAPPASAATAGEAPAVGHRRAETTTRLELQRAGAAAAAVDEGRHRRASARAGRSDDEAAECDGRRVSGELRKQRALLELKNDWTVRVKAMNAIEEVSRENAFARWSDWPRELELLRPLLSEQLSDLRSSIVREACRLLVALCDCAPSAFERELDTYLPLLYKGLYVTIKIIRDSCHDCLAAIVQRLRSARTVHHLMAVGCADPHAIVREKCGGYLQAVLESCTAVQSMAAPAASLAELEASSAELAALIARHMQDSDHGTRAAFRALFRAFSAAFAHRANTVYAELPGVVQRTLDGEKKAATGKGRAPSRKQPAAAK